MKKLCIQIYKPAVILFFLWNFSLPIVADSLLNVVNIDSIYLEQAWDGKNVPPIEMYFEYSINSEDTIHSIEVSNLECDNDEEIFVIQKQNISADPINQRIIDQKNFCLIKATVSGIPIPGIFKGHIHFKNKTRETLETVNIVYSLILVDIVLKENQKVITKNLIGSKWKFLVTPELMNDQISINFSNQGVNPVKITHTSLSMISDKRGIILNETILSRDSSNSIPPGYHIITYPIDVSGIKPGVYEGNLRFDINQLKDIKEVPLIFNVRAAPIWPLLTVILGLILGRFLKIFRKPGVTLQLEFFKQLQRLEETATTLRPPYDKSIKSELDLLKSDINLIPADQQQNEDIRSKLIALQLKVYALKNIDYVQNKTDEVDPENTLLKNALKALRDHIVKLNTLDEIKTTSENVKDLYKKSDTLILGTIPGFIIDIQQITTTPSMTPANQVKQPTENSFKKLLKFFKDPDGVDVSFKFKVIRPIIYGILFLLFIVFAMYELYIDDATFGDDGIYDYYTILVASIGADIASKTLASFAINKSVNLV